MFDGSLRPPSEREVPVSITKGWPPCSAIG